MNGSLANRTIRLDHAVSSGTFNLDGETHRVDNNIWVVGDDSECVVIDAPHSVEDILAVVGDRTVRAIICTHAHDDHIRVAPALRARVGAPILLHPLDEPLWALIHGPSGGEEALGWDDDLSDGQGIEVGGTTLRVIHTPGHTPGGVCLYAADLGCVFTGDTLFRGGPGATGRSYSDRATLDASITKRLFDLPANTVVHPGHGEDTTIAEERAGMAAAKIREIVARRLPGEETNP